MDHYDFDFLVIGGGSAGVRSARVAARHGARVLLIEAGRLGGTCVIRGCVPKKLLVLAGRFADDFRDAAGFGWHLDAPTHAWASLIASKDKEISRLESLYRDGLANAGVQIVHGHGVIIDEHTVCIDPTRLHVTARHILIATGGHPAQNIHVPGIEHTIDSDAMFDLNERPRRLAIVGGGYIAVEFAGLMNSLGSEVTLIHRGRRLLKDFDEELSDALTEAYKARGVHLRLQTEIERIEVQECEKTIVFADGTREPFDQILVATGRVPNTRGLGLENVGIQLKRNAIAVDEQSATNIPSIYAVGDVTDRLTLTPIAIREGHALADRLFGSSPSDLAYGLVPTAVFSTPELATVGMTESQARETRSSVAVYMTTFRPLRATLSKSTERSLMKLVVDSEDGRILGVHLLGDGSAEMIQLAAVALVCGATKAQFDATVAIHPTAAEELVTMSHRIR